MRKNVNGSTKPKLRRRFSSRTLLVAAVAFMLVMGLAVCRFQVFRLERALSDINQGIARLSAEELSYRQTLSTITSPIKIYSYCKDVLGMERTRNVVEVRTRGSEKAASEARWSIAGLLGLGN